jgi:indole-3-glycerol phosphate synthase
MLSHIIASRREYLNRRGNSIMEQFNNNKGLPDPGDFAGAFSHDNQVSLIAEVKKASPSKGTFLIDFNPIELASLYRDNGAEAISVITEDRFFGGNPGFIPEIKNKVSLPVLRKDFIIDEIQLYETRLLGADAVLMIASLLPGRLNKFVEFAQQLGLEPLVEVHNREELQMALDTPVRVIGINNRNLSNFTVDTGVCLDLIFLVPSDITCIAESGIKCATDMATLEEHGFRGALVGEALVTAADIGAKVRELAFYRGEGYDQD